VRLQTYRGSACVLLALLALAACSNERPPPPARSAESDRIPHEPQVETPTKIESTTPYRAKLATHGAELYLPPWFSPQATGYDLIVHFHGLGRLQEANVERAHLNVAVVSVNLGVGTDQYGNAFRDGAAFEKLLAEVEEEIDKSGRRRGAHLRRLALSAWSAGYVSVARVLALPQVVDRVDAVLLADGFFTSFTNIKKRTMNTEPLEKWVHLVEAASQGTKLLAITHTTIPTGDYPSVEEVVAKLLEMTSTSKVPTNTVGPKDMKEIYAVDRGSFHVKGYEGVLAGDHIKQIKMMGETLYPYLKARWDAEDQKRHAAQAAPKK
jgi:hypothetical protein